MAREQTEPAELVPEAVVEAEVRPCQVESLSSEVETTLSTPVHLSLDSGRGIHIFKLVSILPKENLNMS